MKILIIGAGIGGLTAALCAHHVGLTPIVLERADTLREVGAGIQLPPNAMQVFRALGLAERLIDAGFEPEALEARMGVSGRRLFRVDVKPGGTPAWDAPYLHIHRADYIAMLAQALRERAPDALRLGQTVTDIEETGKGVTARTSDGAQLAGDVLIGADGLRSSVRAHLFGPDRPIFTGNMAWRATVPISALGAHIPPPTACVWMGAGRHAVTYRLRGGRLANFVGVVEQDDWREEGWSIRGSAEEALADFEGWDPILTTLIRRAGDISTGLHKWALFDRAPLSAWSKGRIGLLGDSAHPMLPFMAQGAAMAVEDGWVLAQCLVGADDIPAALIAYTTERLARASAVQAASRANMKTFHQRTRLGQIRTYGPMWLGGRLAPGEVRGRLRWIYDFNITAGVT